ncbi:hypothetical protein H5U35_04860, partial [Candidatus Aerophobetes bacterium]|nr:hypothetical protein [Candidatus Aerophobetes bacterium]
MPRHRKKTRIPFTGLIVFTVFAVLFLGNLVVMAQQEPLEKQLEEAKATIADQAKIIQELRENFFKAVGELSEEVERLRAIIKTQKETIDKFTVERRPIEELQAKIAELQAKLEERVALAEKMSQKVNLLSQEVANLLSKKTELETELADKEQTIKNLTATHKQEILQLEQEIAALESKNAEQMRKIKELTDDYFKVTGELNAQIEELKKKNAEQKETIDRMTDNYFKVTGELNAQIEELKTKISQLQEENQQLQAKLAKDAETIQKYYQMVGDLSRE